MFASSETRNVHIASVKCLVVDSCELEVALCLSVNGSEPLSEPRRQIMCTQVVASVHCVVPAEELERLSNKFCASKSGPSG
jgi:hypothetical protein